MKLEVECMRYAMRTVVHKVIANVVKRAALMIRLSVSALASVVINVVYIALAI